MDQEEPRRSGAVWRVGRYTVHGEIALGGMATVRFGCAHEEGGARRPVAIKQLHPQLARNPELVASFLDEAHLSSRVAHANVVRTLDCVQTASESGSELLLVLEYVHGESVAELAKGASAAGERIPLEVALAIVSGVLRGLHAAHEATNELGEALGVVHRDIAPHNVLVGVDGVPRVLDFGVAKAIGRLQTTQEGKVKGRLAYMPPEQIIGLPVSRRSDVYSAGVVLWELIAAQRLFQGDNEGMILAQVLGGSVPAPSSRGVRIPRALDAIVLRAVDADPRKRFATALEMAQAIEALGVAPARVIGEWVERTAARELARRAACLEEMVRVAAPREPAALAPRRRTKARARALAVALIGASALAAVAVALAASSTTATHTAATASEVRAEARAALTHIAPEAAPEIAPSAMTNAVSPAASFAAIAPAEPARSTKPPRTRGAPKPAARPAKVAGCDPPFTVDENGDRHYKRECLRASKP